MKNSSNTKYSSRWDEIKIVIAGETYIFNYKKGQEEAVVDYLKEIAKDSLHPFDRDDAVFVTKILEARSKKGLISLLFA